MLKTKHAVVRAAVRSLGGLALALALAPAWVAGALAQDYPSRLIRVVVPQSPGSAPDLVARIAAPEMGKVLGQSMVVENRPGADYTIGYELVAKQSPADGYTLALVNVEVLALMPMTAKDLRFDPLADLVPVAGLVEGRYILSTSSRQPWKSFTELVSHARATPGKLSFGSPSHQGRLSALAITQAFGLDMLYVPYSAAGAFFQGVASGDVDMGFVAEATAAGMGDRLRILAVSGRERTPVFRDAPTFTELGLPRLRGISFSLNVRAGTPRPVVDRLQSAASRALQQPEVRGQYAKIGMDIINDGAEAAAARFADTAKAYAEIAKKAGL